MSKSKEPPAGVTAASFHAIAASRGDGLHPLILEAMAKTGSVSGPPALSGQSQENVVKVDFRNQAATGKKNVGQAR